MWYEYGVTTVS